MVNNVIKYGIIATISIIFIIDLRKTSFNGHDARRTINSNENHIIQHVSIIKNGSDNSGISSSSMVKREES
jgi:hypothetical protein